MPETRGTKGTRTTTFKFLGLIPLGSVTTRGEEEKTNGAETSRQTALQKALQQGSEDLSPTQQRTRQIRLASMVDVDETAAIGKAVSEQYKTAAEDDLDTQFNYVDAEVTKGLVMHLRQFRATCRVQRATHTMRQMKKFGGFGSLGESMKELQDLLREENVAITKTDDPPRTEEPEDDDDEQDATAALEQEMEETRRRVG